MNPKSVQVLQSLHACSEAVQWFADQPNRIVAWKTCPRGDWMLWLLGKLSGEPESNTRSKVVLCACQCARLSLKHVKGEGRPLAAIETAERWARGEDGVTLKMVHAAAYAAYAAADAAYAADAAADAAYAAAYAAARTKTLAQCADIVRQHYPRPPKV